MCTRQACLACPLYFSIIYITHLPLKRLRKILEDLFIAQGQRPAGLESVKWTELDAIQRFLLTADGTVTQLIEAYLSQPIEIVVLGQQIRQLEHDDPWLVAASGTEVCERQVLLCGRDRVAYLHAVSSIVMDRVSAEVASGLKQQNESIGRLLLQCGVESRRERLWFGEERLDAPPEPIRDWSEVLSRAYRIVSGGRPIMLIEERFPRVWASSSSSEES